MQKRYTITSIAMLILAVMMLTVSCGNDPFFHNVTVNNYNGEAVNSFIHYDGDSYTFPGEMDGFTNILEWVYNGRTYDIGEQVNFPEDSVITAVTGHILSVDNGDNTTQPLIVREYETTVTLPETPAERNGYAFDGWLVDDVLKDASAVVDFSPDMQIKAKWTVLHTVTVDNGNDTTQDLIVRDDVTTTTLPAAPEERDGYVFDGWLVNGVLKDASAVVDFSPDMQVEAKWTVIYTITYDANGGTGTTASTIFRDDKTSVKLSDGSGLENGVLKVYGWNTKTDESGITYRTLADYTAKSDITLYAVWRNEITVTFNSNGGTAVSSQKVISGTSATRPSAPVRKNAIFRFWSLDGVNAFDFNTPLYSDTTLTAVWKTTFTVGERGPANGIIYYINPTSGGSWTYLEASENALGYFAWGPDRNFGVTSWTEGEGLLNTDTVYGKMDGNERNGSSAIAVAKRHSNFANGITYNDWFLPNVGELMQIYFARKKSKIPALPAYSSGAYWSSSEFTLDGKSVTYVRLYDVGTGNAPTYNPKAEAHLVLPVRRF